MNKYLKATTSFVLLTIFSVIIYFSINSRNVVEISILPAKESLDISAQITSSIIQSSITAFSDDPYNYYLFLPSFAEGKKLIFSFSDSLDLSKNLKSNKPLADQQCFALDTDKTLHILVGSNLPTAYLTLEHDLSYITSNQEFSDFGQAVFFDTQGNLAYMGNLDKIKGRGNTSWEDAKKPFNISLENSVSLYDLSTASDYSLITSSDTSFIRNRISDSMATSMDLQTMHRQQINLYINGEYQGIYELCERISADTLSITDIETINDESIDNFTLTQHTTNTFWNDWNNTVTGKWWNWNQDDNVPVTGGYILEADHPIRYDNEPSGFVLNSGAYIVAKEPTYLSESQYNYISTYVQDCEDAMYEALGTGTTDELANYLDVESFISKYLIEEVSKNIDSSSTSQYFHINDNGLLSAGPIWDYDWAYGVNRTYGDIDYSIPIGFSARNVPGSLIWWQILYYIQEYQDMMVAQYENTLYPHLTELTDTIIDLWKKELTPSAVMDYIKNNRADSEESARIAYQEQVNHVSIFLKERMEFLFSEWCS